MNCDDWKNFEQDYVFGDLSDPARELLGRHAASCASCLGEARVLQLVDRTLRAQPILDPPPGLGRRALEPARGGREMWRVGAALLLAGAIGALSGSGVLANGMPDELRRAPALMAEAARNVPGLLRFPSRE